jgi:hypothetical protein
MPVDRPRTAVPSASIRRRVWPLSSVQPGGAVAIHPFLEDGFFDQERIDTMSEALASACRELGLTAKDDAEVRLLAKRIIALAKEGIHEPALLKAAAVTALPGRQKE